MQKTKLLEILRVLSKDEFRRFYKFIKSPWFNSNKNVIKLYEYLRPFHPDFDSPKLSKEIVFKKIFPKEAYLDTRMRTMISLLKRLAENYLVELEMQKNELKYKELLVTALGKRDLYELFNHEIELIFEQFDDAPQRDMNFYHSKMQLHQELFFHPQTAKYSLDHNHLKETLNNLDQFYFLAKLRFSLEVATRKKFIAGNFDNFMLEELLQKIETSKLREANPIIGLYYDILKLHESGRNDQLLDQSIKNFTKYNQLLEFDQKRIILTNLINHCIQVYNTGIQEYLTKQFELYQIGLKKNLVVVNGYISDAAFTNIAVIGSVLKKFEWVNHFITENTKYLNSKFRVEARNLSEAYLFYHQKKYNKTIQKLLAVPFLDITYGFRVRGLLLRTYFECTLEDDTYFEVTMAHLDAFRKYLSRNPTIGKARAKAYTNLISLTQKLIVILVEKFKDKQLLKKLLLEVENTTPVITKAWLKERIQAQL